MVLQRHDATYHKCSVCGHIHIHPVSWIKEAYSEAITSLDVGLVSRNIVLAPVVAAIIERVLPAGNHFLDYGGGYGLFTRLMRDRGFNFYRQDKYCANLFARDFDFDLLPKSARYFDLVTLFEVLEHLQRPLEELEKLLQLTDTLLFSTELIPGEIQDLTNWWYLSPETGQHISFFTIASLQALAKQFNMNFYTNKRNLHLFTRNLKVSDPFPYLERSLGNAGWRWWWRRVTNKLRKVGVLRKPLRNPLTNSDFELALNKLRGNVA